MEDRLIVDTTRLDADGADLEGEVNAVDLDEEFVRPFGGVRYRLRAQMFGSELLVRGHLEQDFELVCSRCGEDFDDTIAVDDFTVSREIDANEPEVDLTDEVRESIILTLPTYPVCGETCPGVERRVQLPADDRWNVLDNMVSKEEGKDGQS